MLGKIVPYLELLLSLLIILGGLFLLVIFPHSESSVEKFRREHRKHFYDFF